jgi:hypothetical protein
VATDLIYGQVKKCYRRRNLVSVTRVMRLETEADFTVALQRLGLSGRLNTAFIERLNLIVRHGVAALTRRNWATSQQAPQLLAHLEWWRAHYHFMRPHASLRMTHVQLHERGGKRLAQRYRQRTPAMAAGRTTRRWTTRDVLCSPLPQGKAKLSKRGSGLLRHVLYLAALRSILWGPLSMSVLKKSGNDGSAGSFSL